MRVLSAAQRQQFDDEGFVVVHDVLDPILDIGPVLAEYADLLDEIALGLYAAGTIESTYADLPFPERLIRVCEAGGRVLPETFDFSLPQSGIEQVLIFKQHAPTGIYSWRLWYQAHD